MSALAPVPLPKWVDTFLATLEETGLEHTAAAAAQTTVRQARKLALESSEFGEAFEEALERATDRLEAEARRRAVEGIEKGVYYQGAQVDTERVYSDSLMALFLKAKRRRQFGDKTEVSGPGGAPLQVTVRKFAPELPDPSGAADVIAGEFTLAAALAPAVPLSADDLL